MPLNDINCDDDDDDKNDSYESILMVHTKLKMCDIFRLRKLCHYTETKAIKLF